MYPHAARQSIDYKYLLESSFHTVFDAYWQRTSDLLPQAYLVSHKR